MLKRILSSKESSGLFYAGASVLAGVFNYLYQAAAAKELSQVEFGELSSWLTYVSLFLVSGIFFQFVSNFFPLTGSRLKQVLFIILGPVCMSLALPFVIGDQVSVFVIGGAAVLFGPIFSWLFGQVQLRMLFYSLGVAAIMSALFKFSFGAFDLSGVPESVRFYWAVVYSFGPASLFLIFILFLSEGKRVSEIESVKRDSNIFVGLSSSLGLAFLAVWIPGMDIMVMDWTQSPETLGLYSRISLIYKAMFFGLFIFSQWLLPQQLRGQGKVFVGRSFSWLKGAGIVAVLAFGLAAGAALLAPFFVELVLGFRLDEYRKWIFLSVFNITVLKAAYFQVQEQNSLQRPAGGLAFGLFLVIEMLIFVQLKLDVSSYLTSVAALNLLAFTALTYHSLMSPVQDQKNP